MTNNWTRGLSAWKALLLKGTCGQTYQGRNTSEDVPETKTKFKIYKKNAKNFKIKLWKTCPAVFLCIGSQIMCAKFHDNQTNTVGAIWKKFDDTHPHRQTDTSISYTLCEIFI